MIPTVQSVTLPAIVMILGLPFRWCVLRQGGITTLILARVAPASLVDLCFRGINKHSRADTTGARWHGCELVPVIASSGY